MTSARDWSGKVGDVWAAEWRRTDRSFADLSRRLDAAIADAAPESGQAIDIGCGAGGTTIALATARPGLTVTGVDLSTDLVSVARMRTASLPNARVVNSDIAAALADLPPANLYCSRHGVMFFDDPAATFTALGQAAAPGAALVFSCFRAPSLNPWASTFAAKVTGAPVADRADYAPGPFGFANRDWVTAMLAGAGWHGVEATAVDFRYVLGAGDDPVADAVGFLRRIGPIARALRDVDDADRPVILDRLHRELEHYVEGEHVVFPAAAWLWQARTNGGTA